MSLKFSLSVCVLLCCAAFTLSKNPFLDELDVNAPNAVEALKGGVTKLIDGSPEKAEFFKNLTPVSGFTKTFAGVTMYIFNVNIQPLSNGTKTRDCDLYIAKDNLVANRDNPNRVPQTYTLMEGGSCLAIFKNRTAAAAQPVLLKTSPPPNLKTKKLICTCTEQEEVNLS